MKRTVSIIISMMCVASALLFTSCQSDPIVGTWQSTGYRTDVNGQKGDFIYVNGRCIEFDKDGSFTDNNLSNDETYYSKWTILSDEGDYLIEPYDNAVYDNAVIEQLVNVLGCDVNVLTPEPVYVYLENDTIGTIETYDIEGDGTKWTVELKFLYKRIK